MSPMRALITGSAERVDTLSKAFEQVGAEPVTLADFGPDCAAVDCYVQLGFTVPARGDTVVKRVHSFLSDGLLERFSTVDRVLPLLADHATVLLVTGNQSAEEAAPDDRAADVQQRRRRGGFRSGGGSQTCRRCGRRSRAPRPGRPVGRRPPRS